MSSGSNMQLRKTLEELGLSHNEASAYLTLLTIGPNAVSTIAKQAGLNRAGCYSVLKGLMGKGFIQETMRDNISWFMAVDPKCIIGHLRVKKDELESKIQTMSKTVEHMDAYRCEYPMRPKIILFEGKTGLQNILEDSLNAKDTIRVFSNLNDLISLLPDYYPHYCRRRIEKGIEVRTIYPENITEYRREFGFHLDIMIYENKVAMTSLKEKFGLLIESREMADSHKKIFDLMWAATSCKKSAPDVQGRSLDN